MTPNIATIIRQHVSLEVRCIDRLASASGSVLNLKVSDRSGILQFFGRPHSALLPSPRPGQGNRGRGRTCLADSSIGSVGLAFNPNVSAERSRTPRRKHRTRTPVLVRCQRRVISNMYVAKGYTIWDAMTRARTNGAVVMIAWHSGARSTPHQARRNAIAFASGLLPHLRALLPS
jgi:hypothetical protein